MAALGPPVSASACVAEEVDNPDGRIAEDIRVATEFAVEFAQSILAMRLAASSPS